MEVVEAAQLVGDVVAAVVGLGDHHHHRVRQRPAREHEQLEHVVEVGRVGAARAHDRQHLLQVVAEELRGELALARAHPVDVAAQRVDLAVVGDHPVRVRQLPAREGVRREAGVDEHERALRARVADVRVAGLELRRHEHALVDDRLRGEAREDQVGPGGELGDAADDVELALEGVLVAGELVGSGDDELLDDRRGRGGGVADGCEVHRDVAPADDALALGLDRARRRAAAARRGARRRRAAGSRRRRRTGRAAAAPPRRPRGRTSSGSCMRIPAPSPVRGSAPAAPRCSRFSSAVIPRWTASCLGTPSSRATNATPQASCSNAGS